MAQTYKAGLVGAVIVAALLGGGVAASAYAAPKTYTVVIDKMKFGPLPPSVRVGDIIQWSNKDIFKHSATAQDGSFDADVPPGKVGRTVLKRVGGVKFTCRYHPGMKGTIMVTK